MPLLPRLLFRLGWAFLAAHASGHESTRPHVLLAQVAPAAAAPAGPSAKLTIDLVVGESRTRVGGLVRITSVDTGRAVELPAHLRRPMGWCSLPPGATVDVPAGELKIEACHGLHTEIGAVTHRVEAGAANRVRVTLRAFLDPAMGGWVSANTHLHLQLNAPRGMGGATLRNRRDAEDYLVAIGKSDALDLVYVSHLSRESENHNYISNELTRDDFARLSDRTLQFVNGEEHRHEGGRSARRGGPDELRYGHVLFLDLPRLIEPVSYGAIFTRGATGHDGIPMRRAIVEAHEQNATVIWCHGKQGTEDVPGWAAGVLHAQNIFDGGSEGTVETIFYPYLNSGLRMPFSTGTDWGCYDFSRVVVPLRGAVSSTAFRQALAKGRSFITNGPWLEFDVEGRTSGDTLEMAAGRPVRLRARGAARDDFGALEVVFNGKVIARTPRRAVDGHFVADLETSVEIGEPGWLALRIPSVHPYNDRTQYTGANANLLGKALFAHTSAVHVTVAGKSVRQPAAIRSLIADVETSIRLIEAKGAFASDTERAELLALYHEAIAALQARLK